MQRTDLIKLLGDDASGIESFTELGDIDRIALLDRVSTQINKVVNVNNFEASPVVKDSGVYIAYKFRNKGDLCKAAIKCVAGESNLDKLLSHILDITDGIEAINLLNEAIHSRDNEVDIKLRWAKQAKASITYWEYTKLEIATSNESLSTILNEYRKGTDRFNTWVNEIVGNKSNLKLSDVLKDSKLYLLDQLHIKIDTSNLEDTLVKCMLNRQDALKIMLDKRESNSKQTIKSLELIDGLGRFAAILIWKIDYTQKSITNYILDNTVLDLDSLEVVTNSAICSRIESRV